MLFLVDLPPPIHGMSAMNAKYVRHFQPRFVVNTAPSFAAGVFGSRAWILSKLLITPVVLIKIITATISGESVCYRAINGGSGQIFDVFYLLLIRIFRLKVVIHHHSFSYLSRNSSLFSFLLKIIGAETFHVVLGERMKTELCSRYKVDPDQVLIVSNSVFFTPAVSVVNPRDVSPVTVGYMANLTLEKGVGVFIDMCIALRNQGCVFDAVLAGPVSGDGVQTYIDKFSSHSGFKYLGPVYEEKKEEFFKQVDIFVFPSQYKNEAEPLVLYEAASYGARLVVTDTGCLADVANVLGGHALKIDECLEDGLQSLVSMLIKKYSPKNRVVVKQLLTEFIDKNKQSLLRLKREITGVSEA